MVTTFPLLSESQAALAGHGNFMHIGSESLHAKAVTRTIPGKYFVAGGEAEFRYDVNGSFWERRLTGRSIAIKEI